MAIAEFFGEESSLYGLITTLAESLLPLMMLVTNIIALPLLVDLVAALRIKETKSEVQRITLRLNLFYMSLNIVFLPLTGLVDYTKFFELLATSTSFYTTIESLSKQMGTMLAFFVSYIIQVSFLTNMIQLLDLPHFVVKSILNCFKKC